MSGSGSIHARARRPVPPVGDAVRGLIEHRVEVDPRDVVFIKSLVEASEGLASIFAVSGGSLTIAAPPTRDAALVELLADLERHHAVRIVPGAPT